MLHACAMSTKANKIYKKRAASLPWGFENEPSGNVRAVLPVFEVPRKIIEIEVTIQ